MMHKTSIAVVITTYNDACFLDRSISSVVYQTELVDEIIIVDDGSNLENKVIIDKVVDDYKDKVNLKKITTENGGPSSARNRGIENSISSFITFLDCDDYWTNSRVKSLKKHISENDCDAYYTGATIKGNRTGVEIYSYGQKHDIYSIGNIGVLGHNGIACGAPFYFFKRELLESVGGFREDLRWNEDIDLIFRILHSGGVIKGYEDYSFVRNVRGDSYSKCHNPEKISNILSVIDNMFEYNVISIKESNNKKKYVLLKHSVEMLKAMDIQSAIYNLEQAFGYGGAIGYKQKLMFYFMKFSKVFL